MASSKVDVGGLKKSEKKGIIIIHQILTTLLFSSI